MEPINDYMMNDHREVDAIFERARDAASAADWAGLEQGCEQFLARIERHIEMEEEILFPAFDEASGMAGVGPSQTMIEEHEQMRPLFAQMREAAKAHDGKRYLEVSQAAFEILHPHNMKEEQMMYPMTDRALGPEGARALVVELKERALAP